VLTRLSARKTVLSVSLAIAFNLVLWCCLTPGSNHLAQVCKGQKKPPPLFLVDRFFGALGIAFSCKWRLRRGQVSVLTEIGPTTGHARIVCQPPSVSGVNHTLCQCSLTPCASWGASSVSLSYAVTSPPGSGIRGPMQATVEHGCCPPLLLEVCRQTQVELGFLLTLWFA
jgi:hypothetical protein